MNINIRIIILNILFSVYSFNSLLQVHIFKFNLSRYFTVLVLVFPNWTGFEPQRSGPLPLSLPICYFGKLCFVSFTPILNPAFTVRLYLKIFVLFSPSAVPPEAFRGLVLLPTSSSEHSVHSVQGFNLNCFLCFVYQEPVLREYYSKSHHELSLTAALCVILYDLKGTSKGRRICLLLFIGYQIKGWPWQHWTIFASRWKVQNNSF